MHRKSSSRENENPVSENWKSGSIFSCENLFSPFYGVDVWHNAETLSEVDWRLHHEEMFS